MADTGRGELVGRGLVGDGVRADAKSRGLVREASVLMLLGRESTNPDDDVPLAAGATRLCHKRGSVRASTEKAFTKIG